MLLYLCLSSHGYGHATRQASILHEVKKLRPDWKIVVSSIVDSKFLNNILLDINVEHRRVRWDVGMVQDNALDVDLNSTSIELNRFYEYINEQINIEAEWILSRSEKSIIVGDIPSSAASLSKKLNLPLIWIGNFGWDNIYNDFGSLFDSHVEKIRREYSQGDLLLKLPFAMNMQWGIPKIDVGMIYSRPRELSSRFKNSISSQKSKNILVGFGGMGLDLDFNLFNKWPSFNFILPQIDNVFIEQDDLPSNLYLLPSRYRLLDVMPFCSRFICKPGFSSFCEAIANSLPMHVALRNNFAESEYLINGLKDLSYHRIITQQKLFSGDWELDQKLLPPNSTPNLINGSIKAAISIVDFVEDYYS